MSSRTNSDLEKCNIYGSIHIIEHQSYCLEFLMLESNRKIGLN